MGLILPSTDTFRRASVSISDRIWTSSETEAIQFANTVAADPLRDRAGAAVFSLLAYLAEDEKAGYCRAAAH